MLGQGKVPGRRLGFARQLLFGQRLDDLGRRSHGKHPGWDIEFFSDKAHGRDPGIFFKLVALIPAKGEEHSYYALRGHGVAFLADETGVPIDKRFVFDSEHHYLQGAGTKPQQAYQAHIESNPVVVFFYGCDDGHVGMRFASQAQAREFIGMLEDFDDVFDFDKNPKAVHKAIMAAETLDAQTQELSMALCYHN